jgi:hypothetical protein
MFTSERHNGPKPNFADKGISTPNTIPADDSSFTMLISLGSSPVTPSDTEAHQLKIDVCKYFFLI